MNETIYLDNVSNESRNLGQDALVSVFKVLKMTATSSNTASFQNVAIHLVCRDSWFYSQKHFMWWLLQVGCQKTDSCQVSERLDPCSLN